MGWFSKKCPRCNSTLQETGYSFPYPQWRCVSCIRNNSQSQKQNDEIVSLKRRLAKLEKNHD